MTFLNGYFLENGFKAKLASIEDVRKSFKDGYIGTDICILRTDRSDALIHNNGYTLEDCEIAEKEGAAFFYDYNEYGNTDFSVTGYENYPDLVKRLVDFLIDCRAKYPETPVDQSGEITYANGNDTTDFDWEYNEHLCEIGWGYDNGEVWAFKCIVGRDGKTKVYCYPHGEQRPVEEITFRLFTDEEAETLKDIICMAADDKGIFDETIDQIWR